MQNIRMEGPRDPAQPLISQMEEQTPVIKNEGPLYADVGRSKQGICEEIKVYDSVSIKTQNSFSIEGFNHRMSF